MFVRARVKAVAAALVVGVIGLIATLTLTDFPGFALGGKGSEATAIALDAVFGATFEPLDRTTAQSLGIFSRSTGLVFTSLREDGPAERAGIRAGDVIELIDKSPVRSPGEAIEVLKRSHSPDIVVTLNRRGRYAVVHLTIPPLSEGSNVVEQGARR